MPSPGYGSPREVKYLHSTGLKIVNVASIKDINEIKKEQEGIIISSNVGMKKRLEILRKAKELNIAVLNLNTDEHIKKIEDFINSKKKGAKLKKEEKSTSKETKEKQELSDEQKKDAEKKIKDKVLTKRT